MGHRLDKEGIQPFLVGFQKHEASQRHGREWRIVRASDKKNMLGFHIDGVLESNSGAWRTKLKGIYR